MTVIPRKALGQHFLVDENILGVIERLGELGCDVVQGFLYAQALSPPAFGRWLLDHSAMRASVMLRSIGQSLSRQPAESASRVATA